jgi:hypothetical protein
MVFLFKVVIESTFNFEKYFFIGTMDHGQTTNPNDTHINNKKTTQTQIKKKNPHKNHKKITCNRQNRQI